MCFESPSTKGALPRLCLWSFPQLLQPTSDSQEPAPPHPPALAQREPPALRTAGRLTGAQPPPRCIPAEGFAPRPDTRIQGCGPEAPEPCRAQGWDAPAQERLTPSTRSEWPQNGREGGCEPGCGLGDGKAVGTRLSWPRDSGICLGTRDRQQRDSGHGAAGSMAPCKLTAWPSWQEGMFVRWAGLAQSRSELSNPRDALGHGAGGQSRAEAAAGPTDTRMKRSPRSLSAMTAPPPPHKSICSSAAPRPTHSSAGPPLPQNPRLESPQIAASARHCPSPGRRAMPGQEESRSCPRCPSAAARPVPGCSWEFGTALPITRSPPIPISWGSGHSPPFSAKGWRRAGSAPTAAGGCWT